jgi:hypothetical protein
MRTTSLAVVGLLAAASLSLTMPAHAQSLSSVSPSTVGNDGTKTLVLTGGGFYPAGQEHVLLRPNPPIVGQADLATTVANKSACSGITVPGLANADCGTELSITVDALNAMPGSYDLVETQTDQSQLQPVDSNRTLARAVTIFSQPTVGTVSPASRGQGATSTIAVSGTGFAAGITADFGPGTSANNVRVESPTSLTVDVSVAGGAAPGTRDVTLTSADARSATSAGAFTVAPGPVVEQVTPARLLRGTSTTVTVKGSHLMAGDGFALTINGADVTNTSVKADGTEVTADVTVPASAPYGLRAVRIRNPDAGTFALANSFAVLAPPGAPSGLSVAAGDGTATVGWTAPADPGSSPVTSYTVSVSDSSVAAKTVSTTTATFTGLANGTAYTFTVTPNNDDGGDGIAATATGTPRYTTALTLTARASATAGQDLVYVGALTRSKDGTPAAGADVALTFVPRVGAPFTRVAQTDANGRFTYSLKAVYTTRVTGAFAGRTEDLGARSLSVTTVVAPRVTVVSPTSGSVSPASRAVTVVGSISPNKKGEFVGLYYGGQLVGHAVVASNGSFRIPVKLARGNYRLVVRIAPTAGNISGQSAAFILQRR